jgi:hypothetical protein
MRFNKFKIYWPYFIFGSFIVVLIVNIAYVVVANDTWRGLFTENSYKKGLNHNRTLEKAEEQKKLGITIVTSIKKSSDGVFLISTFVKDKNYETIPNLKVFYRIKYLPDSKYDFNVQSKQNDNIFRTAIINLLKSGDWEIETVVSNGEFVAQDVKNLTVVINPNISQ